MDLTALFNQILKPALGCTEPVSVAFSVSAAVQAAGGWRPDLDTLPVKGLRVADVVEVTVGVNRNVFKNAFSIAIPNAEGEKGILMAAALGAFCDSRLELELFRNLGPYQLHSARELIEENKVTVSVVDAPHTSLFIDSTVHLSRQGRRCRGRCVIEGDHSHIARLESDGQEIYTVERRKSERGEPAASVQELRSMTLAEILKLVENLPEPVVELLEKTKRMNQRACEAGLVSPLGLGAGFYGREYAESRESFSSATAAGSDARMSGYPVPVMSSAGSGNQGIVATIPVLTYSEQAGIGEGQTIRALAISHLVTMYLTTYLGYLTVLCGAALKAGIGAACGIVYMRGGGPEEIGRAVKIMVATYAGMICDGAKPGCALKVSSSANMAARAADLAMKKVDVKDDNGIVAATAEETIRNLARLQGSMENVDQQILQIMQEKMT